MNPLRVSLACSLALGAAPLPAQFAWQLDPGATPPAHGLAASAFDPVRGTGLLFGGSTYGLANADDKTWLWNGQWQQVFPATTPPARSGAAMTYDAARGVIVMFGGHDANTLPRNDTWTWDGVNWTQMQPATAPSPRSRTAFAYDPQSQKCLLFSGYDNWAALVDTWEWDGTNWTQRTTVTTPPWRNDAQLTYNGSRLTLTGGRSLVAGNHLDVWEWTGANWVMTSATALGCFCGTGSGGRGAHAAFFDSSRGRLVLFGGFRNNALATNGIYNSTMEYDGTNWTYATMPSPPAGRFWPTAFYDSWRGMGVMHGGFGSISPDYSQPFLQTWTYSGPSPATVVPYTTGCAGAAGVPALTMVQRPILGQAYQLALGNLDPQSFPWLILGWSMLNVDLGLVLPQAAPGCILGVNPSVLDLMSGSSLYSLSIPNQPTLLGLALHHQLAQFQFDASLQWVGLSVSAALRGTIGNP